MPQRKAERSSRRSERRSDRRSKDFSKAPKKAEKPAAPLYDDGEKISAEELSDLISTYGNKEKPQREQPKKFKDFDEYINSLLGDSDDGTEN